MMAISWTCSRCTFENTSETTASITTCAMCAHRRTSFGSGSTAKAAAKTPPIKRAKPSNGITGMHAFLSSVGSSKDQEAKKLAKKVQQMRELGIDLPDDQIEALLARNCFSIHVAAGEFFERMASLPTASATEYGASTAQCDERVTNAVVYFESDFTGAPYRLLGSIEVRASITRANTALSIGDRLLFQGENVGGKRARSGTSTVTASGSQATLNGVVRVSTMDHVQLGRLDREWEVAFHPLLKEGLATLGGVCLEPLSASQVFASFRLLLFVYVHPRAFDVFEENHALFHLSDALYWALDRAHSAGTIQAVADKNEEAGDAAPQDLEAIFSAFAPTPTDQLAVDVAAQLVPLFKTDFSLRTHQKQALEWMIWRETQRVSTATDSESADANPLWEQRSFHSKDLYFVNPFERIASLTRPAPPTPCLGGILADDMGMGKTVMLLSLVAYRRHCLPTAPPSTSTSSRRGKTLIIAPLSLLHQWKSEIEDRFRAHAISVIVYYGEGRVPSLLQTDVVLTTYGVLISEFEKPASSALLTSHWDRVILDEAHSIKNRQTNYFRACAALQATHRWCLTGTPLQNALSDVFSLLSFLQYEPWCRNAWWQRVIAKPFEQGDAAALGRLKVLLQPVLLRRTKLSRDRLGQRIVELPPKHVDLVKLTFAFEERAFYQAVFDRSRAEFNGFVASGATSYVAIFALLLRLRQACDHPLLALGRESIEQQEKASPSKQKHHQQLQRQGGESMEQYLHRIATQLQRDTTSEAAPSSYVQNVLTQIREEGVEAQECPVCLDPPRRGVLTPCAHLLCRDCLHESVTADPDAACPVCRAPVDLTKVFAIDSDSSDEIGGSQPSKDDTSDLFVSTKLKQLITDLQSIRAKDTATGGERRKVVVFSQWTHMLEMVGELLAKHGFVSRQFHGALSQEAREKVLREFDRDPAIDVLVISLKAGGVGLNLTCASVVVLLDPWWNPGVEEQAIDRVHRLGQWREVLVKRYVIEDTVEEMILQLQQRKESLAKHVLVAAKAGGDDRTSERLSLQDLMQFFR